MSSQANLTKYQISVSMGSTSGGTLTFLSSDGFTDAMAASIYEALASANYPVAVVPGSNVTVSKGDLAETDYTTGYTTNPVTFS